MTRQLFLEDAYLHSCEAEIVVADENGILLDQTVFYPLGGGQPGDSGVLHLTGGHQIVIAEARKTASGAIVHIPDGAVPLPLPGTRVHAEIDWERRYRHMKMHTCMHLLCAVVDAGVTGGSISADKARLDFDLPDQLLDKEHITQELNRLIGENYSVKPRWITDQELEAQPDLVKTLSVQPPKGQGKVRLLEIEGIDLQPCGGTHVAHTAEIGAVRVAKIEKKSHHNRRVIVKFAD